MNGSDCRFCFSYDEPLSYLIYAACDMILVPSMFEPCGLTQMIAMRFGSGACVCGGGHALWVRCVCVCVCVCGGVGGHALWVRCMCECGGGEA